MSFAEQSFFGAKSQSEQGLRTLIDAVQKFNLRGNETSEPKDETSEPEEGQPT